MLIDYHIHTKLCGHAEGEMEDYVRSAIEKGLDEIGFSDHFPLLHIEPGSLSMKMEDLPVYVNKVRELQKKFKSDISIKLGFEVEYTPQIEEKARQILRDYPADYLLGACHLIGNWMFDHPDHIGKWKEKDIYQVYRDYFSLLQGMARSGLFDTVAHIDLVKKFGHRPKTGLDLLYRELAKAIKECGMCVEVNTSGLRKPVKEIYPAEGFLQICFGMNVPVTLGSDAHNPDEVAMDFNRAVSLIRKVGYTKIATFSNRKRKLVNL